MHGERCGMEQGAVEGEIPGGGEVRHWLFGRAFDDVAIGARE